MTLIESVGKLLANASLHLPHPQVSVLCLAVLLHSVGILKHRGALTSRIMTDSRSLTVMCHKNLLFSIQGHQFTNRKLDSADNMPTNDQQ
jgi:hypothetical protein